MVYLPYWFIKKVNKGRNSTRNLKAGTEQSHWGTLLNGWYPWLAQPAFLYSPASGFQPVNHETLNKPVFAKIFTQRFLTGAKLQRRSGSENNVWGHHSTRNSALGRLRPTAPLGSGRALPTVGLGLSRQLAIKKMPTEHGHRPINSWIEVSSPRCVLSTTETITRRNQLGPSGPQPQ